MRASAPLWKEEHPGTCRDGETFLTFPFAFAGFAGFADFADFADFAA